MKSSFMMFLLTYGWNVLFIEARWSKKYNFIRCCYCCDTGHSFFRSFVRIKQYHINSDVRFVCVWLTLSTSVAAAAAEITDECSAKTQSSIAVNLLLCKYVFCRFVLIREIYLFKLWETLFYTYIDTHFLLFLRNRGKWVYRLERALVRARLSHSLFIVFANA